MSYVLINGKRYYKDDRTGRTTLDNVSPAEANRRAQRNQGPARTTGMAGTAVHTGFPWKAVIACAVLILFIGAFFYNRSHVSSEEQAITNYMNAEDTDSDDEATTAEEDSASALYLMPDSADRYLEVSDIEGYSRDEIQMIINEIYAKHGREFHTQENIDYFSAQDWYEPVVGKSDEEIANEFNAYEKANVELLCKYR